MIVPDCRENTQIHAGESRWGFGVQLENLGLMQGASGERPLGNLSDIKGQCLAVVSLVDLGLDPALGPGLQQMDWDLGVGRGLGSPCSQVHLRCHSRKGTEPVTRWPGDPSS